MNSTVFLICGVSGSGKTWVCQQLKDKFEYVPHDEHYANLPEILLERSTIADKPMLTECPFGERLIKEALEERGLTVKPLFVIENPELIKERFQQREGRELPKSAYTRAFSILDRAIEWGSVYGTADFIYRYLRAAKI